MGYRIDYPPFKKIRGKEIYRSRIAAMTGIFLLLFLFFTHFFWPEGRSALQRLLIPGDDAITSAAMESLFLSIKDGASMKSAITVFCKSFLEGAGIAAY